MPEASSEASSAGLCWAGHSLADSQVVQQALQGDDYPLHNASTTDSGWLETSSAEEKMPLQVLLTDLTFLPAYPKSVFSTERRFI
ncbi:hypothetical protein B5S29_g231 [[Candida] boidinii]|nr:hypothetical protein B5S29_g231 [[Candida] boidinii]